jgi:transcriptional regulator with XRE-family HTH domain
MNSYAVELKLRREREKMTVRDLAAAIDRSTTFVTDFELRKKSNPPEPEMMRRLGEALRWSVDEQLQAWGYELSLPASSTVDPTPAFPDTNPFPLNDLRWKIVVKMQRLDVHDPGADFTIKAIDKLLDLYLTEDELFVGPMGNASNPVDMSTHRGEDSTK